MDCEACRETLSAFLDGELTDREAETVLTHLQGCPECFVEYRSLARFAELTDRLPAHTPGPQLWTRIQTRLNEPRDSLLDTFFSSLVRRWAPISLMGLLVAIVLVFSFWPLTTPAEEQFSGFIERRERVFEEQRQILFERELLDRYRQSRNPFSQPVTFVDYNPFEEQR